MIWQMSFVVCVFVCFQTWEKAIELCKELAEQYESYLYDYVKLGDILVSKWLWACDTFNELKCTGLLCSVGEWTPVAF